MSLSQNRPTKFDQSIQDIEGMYLNIIKARQRAGLHVGAHRWQRGTATTWLPHDKIIDNLQRIYRLICSISPQYHVPWSNSLLRLA